jgi:DNA-binding HxlR family transcriptional regulator
MSVRDFREAGLPLPFPCEKWAENADLIREILDQVGDKWSVLVIGTLGTRSLRYTDLHHAIPGVSQRMLTLTLKQLHRDGLITRTPFAEVPPRVEYALTDLGSTLLSLVLQLSDWAASHHDEIRRRREDYDDASARKAAAQAPH